MAGSVSLHYMNFNIAIRRAKAHNALDRARRANTKCHWDDVEELFEELSEYKRKTKPENPLEKFCEADPGHIECRIYDS